MWVRDKGNAWVIAMLGCVALVIAALASAITTDSIEDAGKKAPTPTMVSSPARSSTPMTAAQGPPPAPVMTPRMRAAAQAAAQAFPWSARLIAGLGPDQYFSAVMQDGPASRYAFAEVSQTTPSGSATYLADIDLSTGTIDLGHRTSGVPTQVGSDISLSVPAATTSHGQPVGPWHLSWVQPGTTRASGDLVVPAAGDGRWRPAASTVDERTSGYIWASCANEVFEVDLAGGTPSHIMSFDANGSVSASSKLDCAAEARTPQVQNPALGLGGRRLYVPVDYLTADPTARVPVRVFELALPSEKVQGDATLRNAITGPTLGPVPGGVWASWSSGMLGGAELLSNNGLAVLTSWYPKGAVPNPVWAVPTPQATWIQSAAEISCVPPGGAQVLASAAIPAQDPGFYAMGVWNGRLFATQGQALLEITPPASCEA
ncbi:MAG: hypothetical protein M0Z47_08215 [Actinomycetota bacterium]|nr:hypothetical protein [Actinomycetota bacterium]